MNGFASRPSKPERLNTRIEVGSTFPVIAMMGIVTPDARSAAQTFVQKVRQNIVIIESSEIKSNQITHCKIALDMRNRQESRCTHLGAVRVLHDDVEQDKIVLRSQRPRHL